MTSNSQPPGIDERTIELIADRVAALLREELEAIAADLARQSDPELPLTVDEVAERFGVARSTVYAHWREWGGYKLGQGKRAAIRFRSTRLPEAFDRDASKSGEPSRPPNSALLGVTRRGGSR